MRKGILLLILTIMAFGAFAQSTQKFQIVIDGEVLEAEITEAGDTLFKKVLDNVFVISKKRFRSSKERRHYYATLYNANVAYPYAVQAVRILRELEATTKDLKKRNRKQHIKRLQNELETEFKTPLKKLTQSQGKMLIEMIEREMKQPMYDLVKDWKGGFSASYWNTLAKMYDVDIKQGYNAEDDPILEMILKSRNVSHDIALN